VFLVRYELNVYVNLLRNSVFKGLMFELIQLFRYHYLLTFKYYVFVLSLSKTPSCLFSRTQRFGDWIQIIPTQLGFLERANLLFRHSSRETEESHINR
jgi:DNA polymerase sigma